MDALRAPTPDDELEAAKRAFHEAVVSPAGRKRLKQAGVKTARRLESDLRRIESNTPPSGTRTPRPGAKK